MNQDKPQTDEDIEKVLTEMRDGSGIAERAGLEILRLRAENKALTEQYLEMKNMAFKLANQCKELVEASSNLRKEITDSMK